MLWVRAADALEGGGGIFSAVLQQCRFRQAERLVERGIEFRCGIGIVRVGAYCRDVEFDGVAARRIEDLARVPCESSFLEQIVDVDRRTPVPATEIRCVFADGSSRRRPRSADLGIVGSTEQPETDSGYGNNRGSPDAEQFGVE